jgi:hypothetical protein
MKTLKIKTAYEVFAEIIEKMEKKERKSSEELSVIRREAGLKGAAATWGKDYTPPLDSSAG